MTRLTYETKDAKWFYNGQPLKHTTRHGFRTEWPSKQKEVIITDNLRELLAIVESEGHKIQEIKKDGTIKTWKGQGPYSPEGKIVSFGGELEDKIIPEEFYQFSRKLW